MESIHVILTRWLQQELIPVTSRGVWLVSVSRKEKESAGLGILAE
jgi:hypothetical protein